MSASNITFNPYQGFEGHHVAETPTPGIEKTFLSGTPREWGSSYTPADADAYANTEPTKKAQWKRLWDAAVARGRWPRVIYAIVGILIGTIWVCLTVFYANEERRFARNRDIKVIELEQNHTDHGGLILEGSLKVFDQTASVLTISWAGIYKSSNGTELNLDWAPNGVGPLEPWPIDIYRDVDTTMAFFNDAQPNDWYFMVKNASTPHIATIGNTAWDNFDTDIEFDGLPGDTSVWKQPLFGYPLDRMAGNITFVASDPEVASLYNLSSYVLPISGARLADYSLNWRFDIQYLTTCQNLTDFSEWAAAMQPLTNATLTRFTFPCHITVMLTASRPPFVRFAVAMAVIVNWTSTLFIFILTCESLIMRRGWMLSGTDLLGVTFTSLFALPTVRMLLPGAPDFGVLVDLIGIIPNVIVISLCITAIAVAKLNRKPKHDRSRTGSD